MHKIAAAIGWMVIVLSIAGEIDPIANFILCYGKKETCTLKASGE